MKSTNCNKKNMADTFSQIYIQVVIVVQNREANIPSVHIEELSKYLTGIIFNF